MENSDKYFYRQNFIKSDKREDNKKVISSILPFFIINDPVN